MELEIKQATENNINIIDSDSSTKKVKKIIDYKEYYKNYYLTKSKEKLLRRIKCPHCGSELYTSNITRHNKTKKHLNYIVNIVENVELSI